MNYSIAARLSAVLQPGETYESVTDNWVVVLTQPLRGDWLVGFGSLSVDLLMLFLAVAWLLYRGVGIWGINIPIAWGFAIVNFVWWIGIGHAGTFISAILLLLISMAHIHQSASPRP